MPARQAHRPLNTQVLIRQMLHGALLCAGIVSAQAASVGASGRCDPAVALAERGGTTQFQSSTQGGASDPYTPAPWRIAVWGDSLTSAPNFMDAALEASAVPKTSVLPSFIQAGMKVPGLSLPLRASCATNGWQTGYAHKDKRSVTGYAKGFLSMRSDTPGDAVFMDFRAPSASTRVQSLTILYDKPRPDSSLLLGVSIDGGTEKLVSLSKAAGTTLDIKPDAPMATIRLRLVAGQITLHGFQPRYQGAPAVVLDTMSVPGGLLRAWSNAGERFFSPAGAPVPQYDLILVEYGTNEGNSPSFNSEEYRGYLRANLGRLRGFYPHARCVLIGPPDRGTLGGGGPMKFANVHRQIAQVQQQVGRDFQCDFWNWQQAMGGPGAAPHWLRMTPSRMQPDLTHLTATGYAASGRMFGNDFPLKPAP
jgi:hypothetical protein